MNLEHTESEENLPSDPYEVLIKICGDIALGKNVDTGALHALAPKCLCPEPLGRLVEAFGRMLEKLGDREGGNVHLLEKLKERNRELENAKALLAERNAHLINVAADRTKNIIGNCPEMLQAVDLAMAVARRPINTLIGGPCGSGKNALGKLIHFNSSRREGPFIVVNCAAISDAIFASEMFGVANGSSGGVTKKKGFMEAAHGGTLFLDEVDAMSLPAQIKLLRALEDGAIMRVGAADPVAVDIKVISVTNASLHEAVKAGKFREDLYYCLNVAEIKLPALKDRGDDILLLAQNFLNRHCEQQGRERLAIAPGACECLLAHHWPGNVRELNNEMERAAALAPGGRIERGDLSPRLRSGQPGMSVRPQGATPDFSPTRELQPVFAQEPQKIAETVPSSVVPEATFATEQGSCIAANTAASASSKSVWAMHGDNDALNLHNIEHDFIQRALKHVGGNRAKAAKMLGLTREALRKKLGR